MNALSRVVSDLTQKKGSRKLKYETTWDGDDVNTMAFCSPLHDPVLQSSIISKGDDDDSTHLPPRYHQQPEDQKSISTKDVPVLEKGSLDLNEIDYDLQFLKQPNPPLKRMSAAFRERFSTDFLRSKSLQKLSNKEDHSVAFSNGFEDCKQTSSLGKIKQQARIIDVHVQQLSNSKKNADNKNLLKYEQIDSD